MSANQANINWHLHNMKAGYLGGGSSEPDPLVIYRELAGITLCCGNTKPTGAGYAPGCVFIHTDGSSSDYLYVNNGTSTTADFELVMDVNNVLSQIATEHNSGTAAGAGPSPLIWDDAPLLDVMLDPTQGFLYFNDYLGDIDVTTGDGYTITQVTSGGISAVADEDGGVLLVDSQGNASADDGVNVQLKNCMFKPVAGRKIYFEARVKFNDTSANTSQFYIGLAGVDTTLIAAGVVDDVVDKAGFFRHAGSTADKLSVIAARTSAEDIDTDKVTVADDTYIKLGFVIDGLTSIKWYADGVLVHTSSVAANIPNAVMCLSYVAQTEGAAKDAEMSVDWVRILQTGTRS